jgi:YrbI family 3-deoxy-D-manno-octulosonate 8-phosphate phosphatase
MTSKAVPSIRFVAFDFDGVFTDDKVYVDQDGREMVCCCRLDGIGLGRLLAAGIGMVVISKETNRVVEARCRKLGVECISGCEDKLGALKKILAKNRVTPDETCFVGNDVHDLDCLRYVGFPAIVGDSVDEVRNAGVAKYTTHAKGGQGAVREICDLICKANRDE